MSMYRAYFESCYDSEGRYKKLYEGQYASYSLNLTNVGKKTHRALPISESHNLIVSPYMEIIDKYDYIPILDVDKRPLACVIMR